MGYSTTKEISKKWAVSQRTVNSYCLDGKIEGVKKSGRLWMIPSNALKPSNRRKKNIENTEIFEYEKSLDIEKKKNHGIYYTDFNLVSLILEEVQPFINKNSVIIDPSCGAGSFILGAINKGYNKTYGFDIDEKAVNLLNDITKREMAFVKDTLFGDTEHEIKEITKSKPDLVIGNPPYVPIKGVSIKGINKTLDNEIVKSFSGMAKNLFILALYRAILITKNEGTISYIIPKNFLHVNSYKNIREYILKEMKIISLIDIGSYFKNVRGEQIVLTMQKQKPSTTHKIKIKILENDTFQDILTINQSYYKNKIYLFQSNLDYEIFNKFSNEYEKLGKVCDGYIGRGRSKSTNAIAGKDIQKFSYKNGRNIPQHGNQIFIQNIYSAESGIIGTFGGNLEAKETITIITDGNREMSEYLLGLLHSRLCNYYLLKFSYNNSKLTMHTDAAYLKELPIVVDKEYFYDVINLVNKLEELEYMAVQWFEVYERLNSLIYKIYNLDLKIIKHIDTKMKEVQSKRWLNSNGR